MKVFTKNSAAEQTSAGVGGGGGQVHPSIQKAPTQGGAHNSMDTRTKAILIAIVILIVGLLAGLVLVRQSQSPQRQAAEQGPSCPLDAFRCTWEKEEGVTYECIIHEITADGSVEVARPNVEEDSETGKGLCTYTPQPNTQYSCTVNAVLFPGCEASDTATGLCTALTPTPSPTLTPSPTMTPTPTPHPQCYITECEPETANHCETLGLPGHKCVDTDEDEDVEDYRCILNEKCVNAPEGNPAACWCFAPTPTPSPTPTPTNTPTPKPSSSPTPTPGATSTPGPTSTPPPGATNTPPPGATNTPVPTDIIVVNPTNTPAPTGTTVVQNVPQTATATPVPTLPVAGTPQATFLILLLGMLVVVVGLAL